MKDFPTRKEIRQQEMICNEKDCMNKGFAIDRLTPFNYQIVCRKHYYMFNYGYSEVEASKK